MHAFVIDGIDGFYGEPAEFDPMLEVELILIGASFADVGLGDVSLDDEWFAFDDTKEYVAPLDLDIMPFDDMPTTRWQRIGDWFRALGRAA